MKFQSSREAATAYIDMGFRVVPLYGVGPVGCLCGSLDCKDRDWGKHGDSDSERWKDGFEFRPGDFDDSSNIAIGLGPWRGDRWLVALDLDGENGIVNVKPFTGELPPTLMQRSPRGLHLIYSVPAYAPLGNWVDVFRTKEQGWSLDLRYARGRIVAAPSRGATGEYRWVYWTEPTPLPERVIDTILDERRARGLLVARHWERGKKDP